MKTSEIVIRKKKPVYIYYVKIRARNVLIKTVQQDLKSTVRAKC